MIPERLVPGTSDWEVYSYEHRQRYAFFAARCHERDILDAACGVGYGSQILAQAGARSVVGADISKKAIDYARRTFACPTTRFVNSAVEDLPVPAACFDIVMSFETIEHLRCPERFVAEMHRVLRPGGVFICSTPNKHFANRGKTANPYHLSEMGFAEFAAVFTTYFVIEERLYQTHSESYQRHLELLRALDQLAKPVRFSKALAFENLVRRRLGRESWAVPSIPRELARALPGDYVIEPFEEPSDRHLTFILVGRAR